MGSKKGFFFLVFLLLLCLPYSTPDLAADRAALLTLRSAVGGRTFRWNASQPTPCNWAGVKCEGNRVTVLRLPGVALTGTLPSGIFSNLTEIRTLSLRLNSLTGPLPSDLADCKTLRNLYLQGNRFSGEIPAFLFQLGDLVRLNLASNNFSGEIPTGLDKLKRLRTLYLENNQLSGSIPALEVKKLEQFNVSFNQLNGSIPARFKGFELSAFEGNSLCGKPLDACAGDDEGGSSIVVPSTPSRDGKPGKKKLSGGAIAGIVIGSVLGFILIVLVLIFLCRKKSRSKSRSIDIASIKQQELEIPGEKPLAEAENGGGGGSGYANSYSVAAAAAAAMVGSGKGADLNGGGAKKLVFFGKAAKVFDLEDLLRASAEVLGKGTFGTAYKAVLEVGTVVAVKRLKDVTITEKEFREKIETVGAMDHENLVPLRAYYYS
ncbi:hypothetical protein Tsubulata_047264, partial [Turnera subulata]